MSPHQLPHCTHRRVLTRLAILPSLEKMLGSFAIAVGLLVSGGTVLAQTQIPALPNRPAGVSNAVVERSVLSAIDSDPELRGVNLVVSVVNGVAVVGGPVSSAAVSKRVEFVVRGVPGIREVKNGCFVSSGPDQLMQAVAERMVTTLPPRPSMTELPGVLTGPQPPVWNAPPGSQNPNLVAAAAPVNKGAGNEVVVRKPANPNGDGLGLLGAPVGVAGSTPAPAPGAVRNSSSGFGQAPGKLTAASGTGVPTNASDILTSAGNVKKVEARFARLTIELSDGVIVIRGTSARASDAWDLGEKLRQIPGVSRVVIAAMAE